MAPRITIRSDGPRFRRPELLQHPPIPRYLYRYNPRTILGKDWWDEHRREAYRANNYHCWACESQSLLHGHEAYTYDYEKRIAKLEEVVALCVPCHRFVHLAIEYQKSLGVFTEDLLEIMNRGMNLLEIAELEPNWLTRALIEKYRLRVRTAPLKLAVEKGFVETDFVKTWSSPTWKLEVDDELYGITANSPPGLLT